MTEDLVKQSIAELQDLVRCRCHDAYKVRGLHDPDCECDNADAVRVVADRIEELETKLAEAEARSEVLETLAMDVAADLYDGVDAHKIDQRIMDAIRQLNEEGEDQ